MKRIIENLVSDFERGKLSRRQLVSAETSLKELAQKCPRIEL
jgi:hypothetical protein